MAVLENSFIVEISSIDKKLKAYLKKLYRIYEKTNDEDQIEEYLIDLYEKLPAEKNFVKDILIASLQEMSINEEDKELLKEIIEEALSSAKTREELQDSETGKLLKEIAKECKSSNAENLIKI